MSARNRVVVLLCLAAACTSPARMYDIVDQPLTCEDANDAAYRTMRAMGFTITGFEPAAIGRRGNIRGTRDNRGTQNVTITIACDGRLATFDASEDGRFFNITEFKRTFFLAFGAVSSSHTADVAAAKEEAAQPLELKRNKELQVLLAPVPGMGSKLDFALDLSAGGVLPVQVTIKNATPRQYRLDPNDDVVLVLKDGTRVPPLSVEEAARRVADAARRQPASDGGAPPTATAVAQRFQARLLSTNLVTANQTLSGYLFFPLGDYVKGRAVMEDTESEESEGFVVEF